ncbi:hypothetical protein B7463_g4457, partial [Scytalidium lignicola]
MSSISDISSMSSPPLPSYRDSMVSLQSPAEDLSSYSDGRRSGNNDSRSPSAKAAESTGMVEPENGKKQEIPTSKHPKILRPRIVPLEDAQRRQSRIATLPDSLKITTPVSPASRGFNPFSRFSGGSYEALSPSAGSSPKNASQRKTWGAYSTRRKASILAKRSIPEDEIDMGLLSSAMPFATQKTSYSRVGEHDEENEPDDIVGAGFDISSFEGPDLLKIHKQEAQGILTGGLGQGIQPEVSIRSADLVASSPISPVALSRKGTFRNPGLSRAPTLRDLGQHEANKRGEVIEVIMEEEGLPVDIGSFAGDNAIPIDMDLESRKTFQTVKSNPTFQSSKVEVFYPQANWKPFTMRWPYLSALILISFTLAGAQEYLYRKSIHTPLYEFHRAADLKTWDYFVFRYLPTMVAVSFGVLWQVTDFEVKRLEAYYQLSKEGGALAAESINVDYITYFTLLRPVLALRFRHYAVAISSIATLVAVSVVPTLLTASVILTPDRATRQNDPEGLKQIWIQAAFSRTLSVILIVIAILGCVLMWQLQRRRSGLVNDVKGIAGIAAMANRSHILMDFKDMDTATPEEIHQKLKKHRYVLQNSSIAPDDKVPLSKQEQNRYDQHKRGDNPHPLMLRLSAGIPYILGMAAFLVLIPFILFTKANVVTDKAPWLLTAITILIKLAWSTLENDVRMMEPFYRLSLRHASPKVLTLDYTAMAFGWTPIRAFINGHVLVGLVGLGSVLAEILTVCAATFGGVAGIDFAHPNAGPSDKNRSAIDAGEETFLSFWVSFSLSIFILAYLCIVACIVYSRRRHPFLPRQPNTIASILAFIHQSKMLYDFVGTEKMNNDEMVKRLVGIQKTYGLGWFKGRDGEMHCGIDEEELARDYSHGKDARHATTPWSSNWGEL